MTLSYLARSQTPDAGGNWLQLPASGNASRSSAKRGRKQPLLAALDEVSQKAVPVARICVPPTRGGQRRKGWQLGKCTTANPLHQDEDVEKPGGPVTEDFQKKIKAALPFGDCYKRFGEAIDAIGLDMPAGQLNHVLRHTFANHYIMNGGDILTLQRVLGRASPAMTMKYAHFSPGHLAEVVTLNPLAKTNGNGVPDGDNDGDGRQA